jgi:hypothetical protein
MYAQGIWGDRRKLYEEFAGSEAAVAAEVKGMTNQALKFITTQPEAELAQQAEALSLDNKVSLFKNYIANVPNLRTA